MILSSVLQDAVQRLSGIAPYLAIGLILEAATRAGRPPDSSLRVNLSYTVLLSLFDAVTVGVFAVAVSKLLHGAPGLGLLAQMLPSGWISVILNTALWVVLRDFCYYWFHRAQHAIDWLWGQHAWHHSDESMNVTTSSRHHWLENPLQQLCVLAPATYLLNPPAALMVPVAIATAAMGHFIHLNVPWSAQRLNVVLTNPQTHRIHHSYAPEHRDKNFAETFHVWDLLFGTYYAPAPGERPPTGLVTPLSRTRLLGWPFVW